MNEIKMEPGRKYRGSAWINKYGEIQFRPEQKGSKPQNLHLVIEHETFSLYESKDIFKATVKFDKKNFNLQSATQRMLFILSQIVAYLK